MDKEAQTHSLSVILAPIPKMETLLKLCLEKKGTDQVFILMVVL